MSVGGENIIRGGRIVDWVIDHPHPRPFNLGRSVPGLRPSTDRPRLKSKKKSHKMWLQLWGQVKRRHKSGSRLDQRTKLAYKVPVKFVNNFCYVSLAQIPVNPIVFYKNFTNKLKFTNFNKL